MTVSVGIIGGGAAGFFTALNIKELIPDAYVKIFEKTRKPLSKVEISGGGRCNVTHHQFDPKRLVSFYPRGNRELLGPFHQFQPQDMWKWLTDRGVALKIEEDGRVFPTTDSSKTIIDCFLREAENLGVVLSLQERVNTIRREGEGFVIITDREQHFDYIVLATGSGKEGHEFAEALGHTIIRPVPSLFGFNIEKGYQELSGVSVNSVTVSIPKTNFKTEGSILITHFGFSGPAILRLSAFAARYLNEKEYLEDIEINWIQESHADALKQLLTLKENHPKKLIENSKWEGIPERLFLKILEKAGIPRSKTFAHLSKEEIYNLAKTLTADRFSIQGKTTNKQEFVTAGGIALNEVDFKTMESKKCKNLFFAGEALDIDGITGGFNFQSAWTTGWIAAHGIKKTTPKS